MTGKLGEGTKVLSGKYHRSMENEAKRHIPKTPRSMYDNPAKGEESTDSGTPREKL